MPTIQKKAASAAAPTTTAAPTRPGQAGPRFGSVRHDLMASTGLANNFWGTIEKVRYAPRRYGDKAGKKSGTYFLAAYLTIRADDSDVGKDGIVTDFMRVADLNNWCPSDEAGVPTGGLSVEDYKSLHEGRGALPDDNDVSRFEGVYMVAVGGQDAPPNGTKWNQWGLEMTKAGFPIDKQGYNVDCFEGVRAFWSRIPFVSKGGSKMELQDGQREPEVLVAAEIDMASIGGGGVGGGAAATVGKKAAVTVKTTKPAAAAPAPAAAPATAAPAPVSAVGADLEERLDTLILGALDSADEVDLGEGITGRGMHKTAIGPLLQTVFAGKELMAAILKVNDDKWLSGDGRSFAFDPDSQLVVLVPAE